MTDRYYDDLYVRKDECAAHREKINKSVEDVNRRTERIETKLNMLIGICGTIGAAAIGILLKMIIGG